MSRPTPKRTPTAVRSAQARVVVFPELSLTGYELAAPAIEAGDPRLEPIVTACAATGSLALVGVPLAGDHIAMLAVDGGGVTVAYRKVWLGSEESARFTPGDEPAVARGRRLAARFGDLQGRDRAAAPERHRRAGHRLLRRRHGEFAHEAQWQSELPPASRPNTGCGWRSRASPGRPAAATRKPLARSGIWDPQGKSVAQAGPEIGALARATLVVT